MTGSSTPECASHLMSPSEWVKGVRWPLAGKVRGFICGTRPWHARGAGSARYWQTQAERARDLGACRPREYTYSWFRDATGRGRVLCSTWLGDDRRVSGAASPICDPYPHPLNGSVT